MNFHRQVAEFRRVSLSKKQKSQYISADSLRLYGKFLLDFDN